MQIYTHTYIYTDTQRAGKYAEMEKDIQRDRQAVRYAHAQTDRQLCIILDRRTMVLCLGSE